MPDVIRRFTRIGFRRELLWAALALLPTALWAGGHTIKVRPPNGVDDTATIQAALDAGVASGPGTTVQLAAGRYLTQQLAVYNFHGTFQGTGRDKTIIEALPHLQVNANANFCNSPGLPNVTNNRWPSLIIFVDGDIRISDLSIKVLAAPGTTTATWWLCDSPCTFLLDAIRIMGTTRTNVWVEGISIEGLPDDSPTSGYGFNLLNGVDFLGELARSTAELDYYYLSGNFTVRNSYIRAAAASIGVGGLVRDARVTIGGSPAAGNVLENALVGLDIEGAENSSFELSHNRSEGMWDSMWVVPWLGIVPNKPAQYSIHDNTFITTAPYADGLYLQDDPAKPWIHAMVYNNTIQLKSDFMWAGIGAYNTKGTVLWNNTITGTGAAAIQLGGDEGTDTLGTILGNHIRGFYADPSYGLAQIHLGPATNHNLVVCASPLDTVLDQGTKNLIVGGWPQARTSVEAPGLKAVPDTPFARPDFMKRKPGLRK